MIYTYNGLVAEIKARLSLMSDWNTILYYGVYQRIVDMLAYTGDKLVYLAEFLYREAKWFTAEKRDSLVKLAKWLGYVPYRKTGAIGTLQISADSTFNPAYIYTGTDVRIPRWTMFNDVDNSLAVYSIEDTIYYTGTTGNLDVSVKEGAPKEFLYIANGVANETISLYSDSVDNEELQIWVVDTSDNFLYEVIVASNLYLIDNLVDYYCQIDNSPAYDYIDIMFGDGINSKKLSVGERILIKYADTNGSLGDITSSGVIEVIKPIITDEDNNIITLYCTHAEGIIGGMEIEDIESIRNNAPNVFQIGSVLSSSTNWISLINSVSFVNKSIVWTAVDLGISNFANQNIVYYTAVSSTGEDLTTTQRTTLEIDYSLPKKCLTEVMSFQSLEKIYIRFDVTAKIAINKSLSVVDAAIKLALNNAYNILNAEFQQNIYESNAYRVIDSVSDVVYHSTDMYYLEKDLNPTVSNYKLLPSFLPAESVDLDKQSFLVANSFEIWIRRKGQVTPDVWEIPLQIASTTGTVITGMNGYTISGGFVSSVTNLYSFTVVEVAADITHAIYGVQNPGTTDHTGYILYISYKMQDGNTPAGQQNSIRLPWFYQITDIEESFINTDLDYIYKEIK